VRDIVHPTHTTIKNVLLKFPKLHVLVIKYCSPWLKSLNIPIMNDTRLGSRALFVEPACPLLPVTEELAISALVNIMSINSRVVFLKSSFLSKCFLAWIICTIVSESYMYTTAVLQNLNSMHPTLHMHTYMYNWTQLILFAKHKIVKTFRINKRKGRLLELIANLCWPLMLVCN